MWTAVAHLANFILRFAPVDFLACEWGNRSLLSCAIWQFRTPARRFTPLIGLHSL